MIDTHLHILPGVDDGPESLEEALALARVLVQEGISAAIATPHYNDEFPRRSAAEIAARVYDMQYALNRSGIPLRLFPGHEALISQDCWKISRLAGSRRSMAVATCCWN